MAVRHTPMDRVREGEESVGEVQNTLWQQMLAATGAQVASNGMSESSAYAQVGQRQPIGPEISNARYGGTMPQMTYVPTHQVVPTYVSGTKYRAFHPYPVNDKLLDTFDSMDIHSIASLRSVAPRSDRETRSGRTFGSYLNDLSSREVLGRSSVKSRTGGTITAAVNGVQLETEDLKREPSPSETVRPQGIVVKVEECDDVFVY
jgi:hypothetical protein